MTRWSQQEISQLAPILMQMEQDLYPLNEKQICVLCSGFGELVFRLDKKMRQKGKIIGLERSRKALQQAKTFAAQNQFRAQSSFQLITKNKLPYANHTFDALVSEFIIYPTPLPTEIGQLEMARVVKPGGTILLTDVLRTHPMSKKETQALKHIDIHYLCDATFSDFQTWMTAAGLTNITIRDFTPLLQTIWSQRAAKNTDKTHRVGYNLLLHDNKLKLGEGIFYIYAKGNTPP
ncbi:MAG: methyltransferase domain-containing protein [Promethearchaeota archaeon]